MKELKQKLCKSQTCDTTFTPWNSLQIACGPVCAIDIGKQRQAKRESKRAQAQKKTHAQEKRDYYANDRPYQIKKTQEVFNAFIRERDKNLPCISSGRMTGQRHAGHYKSIGAHPELRFNEFNVNVQSMKDNSHLSGNIEGYRKGLIEKYGIETVEFLERHHELKKYTLEDLAQIKEKYKKKLKELQAG